MSARSSLLLVLWWLVCAAGAVTARLLSPGILEGGDGVQHYLITRFAWKHPELLLNHWGKPLFTLFASPFAQMGHWGMTLFNALCFVITCWAADGLLRRSGQLGRWLFPPALLLVPVYGTMVLAGMTEVFFAMLAMLVVRALFEERYAIAMLIVSFMPFARPEYIAFVPFAIGWVMWKGQWRALPFVVAGHFLYAVVGAFVLGDALWAFHDDPYRGAQEIYGHGTPFHFVVHLYNILGAPLTWMALTGLIAGVVLWVRHRDDRAVLNLLFVLAVLPSLAILLIHSVLWWQGWKGSLGLFRVMATAAPLVVLFALWPLMRSAPILLRTTTGRVLASLMGGGLYLQWAVAGFLAERPLPVVPSPYDQFIRSVGERVGEIKDRYRRLTYYHPMVAYHADIDPYDTTTTRQAHGHDNRYPGVGLEPNDLLVWDAHFGPNERGMPLERLLADEELELLELMIPAERMEVLGGQRLEAFLFTLRKAERKEERQVLFDQAAPWSTNIEQRFDTMACAAKGPGWCFRAGEYPLELGPIPTSAADLIYMEITVSGGLEWIDAEEGEAHLVFAEEGPSGRVSYWSQPLTPAFAHVHRIPARDPDISNKLYLWNNSRVPFRITCLKLEALYVRRAAPRDH